MSEISDNEIKRLIGKRIMQERKKKGLTQLELAEAIDSSSGHISDIERGLVDPGITIIYHICYVLDISLSELVQGQRMKNDFPNGLTDKIKKLTDEQIELLFGLIEFFDIRNRNREEPS